MDAKKRKKLDFSTKADIIRRVEAGEKKSSVAKEFGIPRSTLSTILRHKADVKAKAAQCGRFGACRVRAPEYDKVEKALYAWFLETRAKNIPVDGPMLMEKAKWFATALGEDNFTGGTGWQQRFKNRYDIVGKTLSGESGATSSNNSIEKWLSDEWPDICNSFSPSQIFNADETALFWQMLPSKTLDFKGSKCHGGKMSKVRISILLAANMDGSCKLQPFVIGKSRSPRCFKNARGLSVRYASNKKAWMTRDLFTEWLRAWDTELEKSGRQVCLLLDNCSAHHVAIQLKNITVKFLPANTTAKLQPLDQGIIKAFKVGYRRRLVQRLLTNLRLGIELKVDLLGATQMLTGAWNDVKQTTVVNCFRKAGCVVTPDEACSDTEDDGVECFDCEFQALAAFPGAIQDGATARDFLSADDDAQAVADLTDAEIVADIAIAAAEEAATSDSDEDIHPPTAAELASAFSVIRRCCGAMEGAGLSHLDSVSKLEDSLMNFMAQKKKQSKLTDFFHAK